LPYNGEHVHGPATLDVTKKHAKAHLHKSANRSALRKWLGLPDPFEKRKREREARERYAAERQAATWRAMAEVFREQFEAATK